MSEETRVVLVKPGDMLLIGNVGDLGRDTGALVKSIYDTLGIGVVLFANDIDIAAIPTDGNEGG